MNTFSFSIFFHFQELFPSACKRRRPLGCARAPTRRRLSRRGAPGTWRTPGSTRSRTWRRSGTAPRPPRDCTPPNTSQLQKAHRGCPIFVTNATAAVSLLLLRCHFYWRGIAFTAAVSLLLQRYRFYCGGITFTAAVSLSLERYRFHLLQRCHLLERYRFYCGGVTLQRRSHFYCVSVTFTAAVSLLLRRCHFWSQVGEPR